MNVEYALDKIKSLVSSLSKKDTEDRIITYASIVTIINRLSEITKDEVIPNFSTYKNELLWSCEALCGLDDGNSHIEENHMTWALSAINKLKSVHCFNVK